MPGVERHQRRGEARLAQLGVLAAQRVELVGDRPLRQVLEPGVERGLDPEAAAVLDARRFSSATSSAIHERNCRGAEERGGESLPRTGCALARSTSRLVGPLEVVQTRQHPVAPLAQRRRVLERREAVRGLDHRRQRAASSSVSDWAGLEK